MRCCLTEQPQQSLEQDPEFKLCHLSSLQKNCKEKCLKILQRWLHEHTLIVE